MKPFRLVLGLCVLALVVFLWLRSNEPPPALAPQESASAVPGAQRVDAAIELSAALTRTTPARTAESEAKNEEAAPTPVPQSAAAAATERPDHERVGVPLPPRTIEGIVLRGMTPVNGGSAWLRASTQPAECKGDAPQVSDMRTEIAPDGVFQFDGVEPGWYCVGVEVEGGVRRVHARRVDSGRSAFRMVFRLGGSSIRGRVFEQSGAPASEVVVRVESTLPDMSGNLIATTVLTAENGAYRFASLQPGSYSVCVDDARLAVDCALVDLGVDEERALDFGSPLGQATWSGGLLAPDGASLQVGWSVRLRAHAGDALRGFASDASGSFQVVLTPGLHELLVNTVDGWRPFGDFDMPRNDVQRDLTLPPAWVVVRIRREEGAPPADATSTFVYLSHAEQRTRTIMAVPSERGEYHFMGVPPGEYEAWLSGAVRSKKEPPKTRVTVTPDDLRVRAEIVVPKSP
ncbi:MAG: carboxypeptidase regulatory-like domain-containing protein [Planctomycetota bacterium]